MRLLALLLFCRALLLLLLAAVCFLVFLLLLLLLLFGFSRECRNFVFGRLLLLLLVLLLALRTGHEFLSAAEREERAESDVVFLLLFGRFFFCWFCWFCRFCLLWRFGFGSGVFRLCRFLYLFYGCLHVFSRGFGLGCWSHDNLGSRSCHVGGRLSFLFLGCALCRGFLCCRFLLFRFFCLSGLRGRLCLLFFAVFLRFSLFGGSLYSRSLCVVIAFWLGCFFLGFCFWFFSLRFRSRFFGAVYRLLVEDCENQVLLGHFVGFLDVECFGNLEQFFWRGCI